MPWLHYGDHNMEPSISFRFATCVVWSGHSEGRCQLLSYRKELVIVSKNCLFLMTHQPPLRIRILVDIANDDMDGSILKDIRNSVSSSDYATENNSLCP